MEKLSFVVEIPEVEKLIEKINFGNNDLLKDLALMLIKEASVELFVKVFESFIGLNVSFTKKPIEELKKLYVLYNPDMNPAKLAQMFNVHERTIYQWRRDLRK